jgi:hypothetical protein
VRSGKILLRQPAFVPQSRDYGESRGFGGPGKRYNGIIRIMLCKSSIAYAVLIDICSPVNRAVNTDAIQRRTWRRCDVLVRLGPGSKRGCKKSCAIHQLIGVSAICCALGDFPHKALGLCHALAGRGQCEAKRISQSQLLSSLNSYHFASFFRPQPLQMFWERVTR